LRWTVDTAEDLEFIRQITKRFKCRDDFSWMDVLKKIKENPEIAKINAEISHKTMKDIDARVNLK